MIFKDQDLEEISKILQFNQESNTWEVEFESCVDLEYLKIYLEPKEIWVNPCRIVLEFFVECAGGGGFLRLLKKFARFIIGNFWILK